MENLSCALERLKPMHALKVVAAADVAVLDGKLPARTRDSVAAEGKVLQEGL